MVLNGDILEYQNVGPMEAVEGEVQGGIDLAGIELLINFMEFAWTQWSYTSILRLNGGGKNWKQMVTQAATNVAYRTLGPRGVSRVLRYVYPSKYKKYQRTMNDKQIEEYEEKRNARIRKRMSRKFPQKYDVEFDTEQNVVNPVHPVTAQSLLYKEQMAKFDSGARMLDHKNSLTRMYKTHMRYVMSAVKVTQVMTKKKTDVSPWWQSANCSNHSTFVGNGPALYTVVDDTDRVYGNFSKTGTAPFTGNRNQVLWEPNLADYGFFQTYDSWYNADDVTRLKHRGIGAGSPVYVFNADWVGTPMNPDPFTQQSTKYNNEFDTDAAGTEDIVKDPLPSYISSKMNGNLLQWEYVPYDVTTDQNIPIQMSSIFENRDWTYLSHFYTKYNFKFRNYSRRQYCVEIMVFKFKAERRTFNYDRMVTANQNKQQEKLQDYMDDVTGPPADIEVLYRKRIVIQGMNEITSGSSAYSSNTKGTNTRNFKYIHKRKYIIKRPILNSYNTYADEFEAYNTYYDHEKAHYFRMQAWPMCPNLDIDTGQSGGPVLNANEDTNCLPVSTDLGTKLSNAVHVVIDKKSYFKLDEPMFKSYTKTT